jgi:peptidoglycan/LPS O-acetylase OafA/YrhL
MSARRIVFIDALRGAAAALVLIQHLADRLIGVHATSESWLRGIFVNSFDAGRFGVGLFFIISGFVIPFSIRGRWPIHDFFVSRFFRLYPAYWASIACAYICLLYLHNYGVPAYALFVNATMFEGALGVPVILGPYWTLIIELMFYFACVALHYAGWLRSRFAPTVMFCGCLAACWALTLAGLLTHHYHSANLALNMGLMFFGLMIRRGEEGSSGRLSREVVLGGAALMVSIPAILALAPGRHEGLFTPLSFSSGYMLAIIAFMAAHRWLTFKVSALVWLGSISYSLYLFHEIFLLAFERLLQPGAHLPVQVLFVGLVISCSLAAGWVVYRFVELPCIRIGKTLLAGPATVPQPAG